MQIYTNTNSTFPDQVVPDDVKATPEYGYRVGQAIEGEWFWAGRSRNRFQENYLLFIRTNSFQLILFHALHFLYYYNLSIFE